LSCNEILAKISNLEAKKKKSRWTVLFIGSESPKGRKQNLPCVTLVVHTKSFTLYFLGFFFFFILQKHPFVERKHTTKRIQEEDAGIHS
jgi:hypothetical protein